jgi:hypothetical protein
MADGGGRTALTPWLAKARRLIGRDDARARGESDRTRGREAERQAGGRGLASLANRAEALGGRLSAHADGGRFELTVRVPLPARASARRGGEDALAAGDPAHGVNEVVGGTVLHEEP